jgi:hypothetical protein
VAPLVIFTGRHNLFLGRRLLAGFAGTLACLFSVPRVKLHLAAFLFTAPWPLFICFTVLAVVIFFHFLDCPSLADHLAAMHLVVGNVESAVSARWY